MSTGEPDTTLATDVRRTADVIRALDSALRIKIVSTLSNRQCFVHELVAVLGKSQPLVSQHLKIMKDAGIVDCERRGREVVYWLPHNKVTDIIRLASLIAEETKAEEERTELELLESEVSEISKDDHWDTTEAGMPAATQDSPLRVVAEGADGVAASPAPSSAGTESTGIAGETTSGTKGL